MVRFAVKATLISLRLLPFPFAVDLTTFSIVLLDTWSINSKLSFPKSRLFCSVAGGGCSFVHTPEAGGAVVIVASTT